MSRSRIVLPLVSLFTVVAISAQAQTSTAPPPAASPRASQPVPPQTSQPTPTANSSNPGPAAAVKNAHVARRPNPHVVRAAGPLPMRHFAGHPYRGHLAWEGGHWRHEIHDGRDGWWWDVGGVWYWYPQRVDGPPTYISEDYADDVVYGPPVAAYGPPPGAYPPPDAYPPPPPPPPPDPGASAVGGAIVGGLLGGLLTGRASGAAAGAIVGGATGAIAGATAASRPGYWMAEGNCYYRYPDGQYVLADPRWCY